MDNTQQENQPNQPNQPEQIRYDTVQHNQAKIPPTASEIGYLWSNYFAETMSVCMLKYIVAKSKDPDFKPIFQRALDVSSQRVNSIKDIFNLFHHPIPEAFGEKDVEINARELFSESYLLTYTRQTNRLILLNYSQAYGVSYRPEIRVFFNECIDTCQEIIQKSSDILLAKGLLLKSPYIVISDRVEYVYDKNYYGSLLGSKRPLNALEINYIFDNLFSNQILKTMNLGMGQVVMDEKVNKYLSWGKKITDKQVKRLRTLLEEEELPSPTTHAFEVTKSKEPPFSDKLIMFHITTVTAFSILEYGIGLTNTARKDVAATFARSITELIHFAKDGTDIMIERGWLEKPPETADRGELTQ